MEMGMKSDTEDAYGSPDRNVLLRNPTHTHTLLDKKKVHSLAAIR